jgi:hypothetical protein
MAEGVSVAKRDPETTPFFEPLFGAVRRSLLSRVAEGVLHPLISYSISGGPDGPSQPYDLVLGFQNTCFSASSRAWTIEIKSELFG